MVSLGAIVTDVAKAEPADYGLLNPAVTVITDDSPHWINGFSYPTLECSTEVTLRAICNNTVSVSAVEAGGTGLYGKTIPFAIETSFKCSTMGMTPQEVEDIARDRLEVCTPKALEYEFWTGSLARAAAADASWDELEDGPYPNRYLASDDSIDVTPTPGTGVRAKHALALLEGALADCGCGVKGMVHVTHEVASVLNIKGTDGVMKTALNNVIIAGAGYTGSGPGDVAPGAGKVWMYATGPVTVRLGAQDVFPTKTGQSVNIATNETLITAERPGAATWGSCCHYAVLVDLSLDYA